MPKTSPNLVICAKLSPNSSSACLLLLFIIPAVTYFPRTKDSRFGSNNAASSDGMRCSKSERTLSFIRSIFSCSAAASWTS